MSNYFDLKCLDCDEKTGWSDGNRAHRELLDIMKLRPELEALGLASKKLGDGHSYALEMAVPRWATFFAEHVNHTVVVKSEYWNDAYFGCSETVDEEYRRDPGPRENTHECRLDAGHDGPHSRTRPDGK